MTKRALLLGSQIDGLGGVNNDLQAVGQRFRERGFELDVRSGTSATREAILDGYARLIHDSRSGDSAVVYFSGHGCRLQNPAPVARQRGIVQCIVPTDWGRGGVFRGITDVELSMMQAELTGKTDNVASIFDCCHAATMSRIAQPHEERIAKVTERSWHDGVEGFSILDEARAALLHAESNPRAVRLGAAEPDRSAYEMQHTLCGVRLRMGNLTWALCYVLDEWGTTPLSWSSLLARVRELVLRLEPTQCPQLEGPADRVLFTTTSAARRDAVIFFLDGQGNPRIRASRLLGACPGAEYALQPLTSDGFNPEHTAAVATVIENEGPTSLVSLSDVRPGYEPQTGDLAFPRRLSYPRLSVAVSGSSGLVAQLRSLIDQSRFVTHARPDELPYLVLAVDHRLHLLGPDGTDLVAPLPASPNAAVAMLRSAERWSRAHALLHLQADGLPPDSVSVGWGRVEGGVRVPMVAGERVHVGDRVYVDVENQSDSPLWVALFDIGTTGRITLLTHATPTGRKLEPAGDIASRYTLGEVFGTLMGLGPGHLPDDTPDTREDRRESLVILASQHPVDFFVLETAEPERTLRTGSSELSGVLEWFREGSLRDLRADRSSTAYSITRIDFAFSPQRRDASSSHRDESDRGVIAALTPRQQASLPRVTPADLKPADILLSLGGGSVSEAIHVLDGGWYSHVALWTGDHVIESTDPAVRCCALRESVEQGARLHVDVYRHNRASELQRLRVVEHARRYLGRSYAWGDLLLGGVIVSSGAFLFRSSERSQRAWLSAMQNLNRLFALDRERAGELVTCAELVARSYCAAEIPIQINLQGLRRYDRTNLGAAFAELIREHGPTSKGDDLEVLREIARFRTAVRELGADAAGLTVHDDPSRRSARGVSSSAVAGVNWGANLVTPRDLMQSDDLELIGCLHP